MRQKGVFETFKHDMALSVLMLCLSALLPSCSQKVLNPYLDSSKKAQLNYKKLPLPFPDGTSFTVHQGAFGKFTHNEPGNEYHWDLDVPFGTDVLAVEDGVVLGVYESNKGGGCSNRYRDLAHIIHIEHADGTVAQYVHIQSLIRKGKIVRKGDIIAHTAENGWICIPHLHFGVFQSRKHLYNSPKRKTIPIFFLGVRGGLLREGGTYRYRIGKDHSNRTTLQAHEACMLSAINLKNGAL